VDFVGDLSATPPVPQQNAVGVRSSLARPQPRLDIPAKVAGTATFGIDVRLPGLFYAAWYAMPTFGGRAASR
jgi:isoquinoline 1-oxidoreductase beta subunit